MATMRWMFGVVAALMLASTALARAAEPAPGATWVEPRTGIAFVWVPAGDVTMGCAPGAQPCPPEELPQHQRHVGGFWMSRTEITQGQWRRLMDVNPSMYKKGDDYPVDQVHWEEALTFLGRLNDGAKGEFRLPTEAEWEYACRAGHPGDAFCGGGDANALAWYILNTSRSRSPMPVGQKTANAFGLYDMTGNMWEWTADCWAESHAGAPGDGRARTDSACLTHVLRGGSWGNYPAQLRASARRSDNDVKCPFIGLRLVRAPVTP
ncbi:MAG: formylglycine-generating enzyme family protein [Bacteroidota bacterium]